MSKEKTSHFRTTELANLPSQVGTMKAMTVKSPALSARADLSIFIPDQAKDLSKVPVVILLHGVWGSHWVWSLMGEAHLTLQQMIDAGELPPMILAMPSDGLWGDGSGYLKHAHQDFEKWIVEDVPHAVSEATGNALTAPHFIAGLSMGGFGALRLGAKHPDRFAAFVGHSSITDIAQLPLFVEESLSDYTQEDPSDHSVLETILKHRASLRPFRFDCGVDDLLIEHNRELKRAFDEAGIDHEYEEHPGGHEWPYWVTHLRETLRFFAKQLA
ncbi:alpha/beta hydrolase [Haloferula chungangensis]|uniref:Alpha/beta hydrolase n=1 Tax=Haloferula chungangensis TaxID=1048331 RepID=A0ABW2L4Y2_9BACT